MAFGAYSFLKRPVNKLIINYDSGNLYVYTEDSKVKVIEGVVDSGVMEGKFIHQAGSNELIFFREEYYNSQVSKAIIVYNYFIDDAVEYRIGEVYIPLDSNLQLIQLYKRNILNVTQNLYGNKLRASYLIGEKNVVLSSYSTTYQTIDFSYQNGFLDYQAGNLVGPVEIAPSLLPYLKPGFALSNDSKYLFTMNSNRVDLDTGDGIVSLNVLEVYKIDMSTGERSAITSETNNFRSVVGVFQFTTEYDILITENGNLEVIVVYGDTKNSYIYNIEEDRWDVGDDEELKVSELILDDSAYLTYTNKMSKYETYYLFENKDKTVIAEAYENSSQNYVKIYKPQSQLCEIYLLDSKEYILLDNYSTESDSCQSLLRSGDLILYREKNSYPEERKFSSDPRKISQKIYMYNIKDNSGGLLLDSDNQGKDEIRLVTTHGSNVFVITRNKALLYSIKDNQVQEVPILSAELSIKFDLNALVDTELTHTRLAIPTISSLWGGYKIDYNSAQSKVKLTSIDKIEFDKEYTYEIEIDFKDGVWKDQML